MTEDELYDLVYATCGQDPAHEVVERAMAKGLLFAADGYWLPKILNEARLTRDILERLETVWTGPKSYSAVSVSVSEASEAPDAPDAPSWYPPGTTPDVCDDNDCTNVRCLFEIAIPKSKVRECLGDKIRFWKGEKCFWEGSANEVEEAVIDTYIEAYEAAWEELLSGEELPETDITGCECVDCRD